MDAFKSASPGNTVRAPGAPFARPRAALSRKVSINRESNALRASVLDVAMQIGLGAQGAVTDWVYNNSVNEDEEDSAVSSPSLTNGSSATSENFSPTSSARFLYSPPSSSRSIASAKSLFSLSKPFSPGALSILEESPSIIEEDPRQPPSTATSVSFIDHPMQLPSVSVRIPAKLKKRRTDGYESEGGYITDSKTNKKDKRGTRGQKVGGDDESSVGGKNARLTKEEKELEKKQKEAAARHRAKSLTTRRNEKDMKPDDSVISKGYETDAPARRRFGKKNKAGMVDGGYETDAGYLSSGSPALGSKKSKSKFFGLGGKSSKPDLVAQNASPKVAKEPSSTVPLPIAQKFGTVLGKTSPASSLPTLPPLPALDTGLSPTVFAHNTLPSSISAPPPLSAPIPRVESKKDSLSDKGPRDSQVSGESSRSSTSYASTGTSQDAKAPKRKTFRFLTGAKSSPTLSSSSNKFPAISLPLTRATSPAPPDTSITHANQSQEHPDLFSPDILRSPSPSPSKSRSNAEETRGQHNNAPPPTFLSPTSQPRSASPALLTPNSPSVIVTNATSAPSSPSVKRIPSSRPRNSILSVNTHLSLASPTSSKRFSRGRSPSPIPSSDWIVPSPSGTSSMSQPSVASSGTLPVPSPNMYSFYDIPPPSPPPNGPLPKVPDVAKSDLEDDPFGVNGASVIRSLSTAQRGKDVPFLTRLRGRASSHNVPKPNNPAPPASAGSSRSTTKERISPPYSSLNGSFDKRRSDGSKKSQEPEFNNDDNASEILDVLDRFAEAHVHHRDEREPTGRALGRRRSSEAFRSDAVPSQQRRDNMPSVNGDRGDDLLDDPEAFHCREFSRKRRSTVYYSDEEDGADPRLSRWSGSVYSRASFMDSQKSEETRARFVSKVEAMLDEAGIERGNKRNWDAVPPVPKLPESLAKSNLLTRQNQLKGAGLTTGVNGWI